MTAGEGRAVAFGSSSPLGHIKHFARLLFLTVILLIFLDTFQKLFQRREKVKLSIALHFVHLAYIYLIRMQRRFLSAVPETTAFLFKLNGCICRALTVV